MESMSGVTISRDDAIVAIEALKFRITHNRELVAYFESRGYDKRAAEQREAEQRYQDVIARIREAMTAQADGSHDAAGSVGILI